MRKIRTFLNAAAVIVAGHLCAGAAMADMVPLARLSDYLNGLQSAQSAFTQINDDGTLSTGTLYIKRPGRARFEYDGTDAGRVVAGQGQVVIVDPKSNQPPETYPLKRTPLSIILAERVNLGRAQMVVAHDFDGTATRVRAQDPENPDYGSIDLYFTDQPVELRKWVITDGGGGRTTVVLGGMQAGVRLSNKLFETNAAGLGTDR